MTYRVGDVTAPHPSDPTLDSRETAEQVAEDLFRDSTDDAPAFGLWDEEGTLLAIFADGRWFI